MAEDEFTKHFKYMQRIESKIDVMSENMATKEDIRKILSTLDTLAKRVEINDDERLVMGHQLERLDRWTHELADKIGYKLAI